MPDNYNGAARWLALDGKGRPSAVFLSSAFGNRAVVVTYDGSSWKILGKPGFESEAPIMSAAIAVDPSSGTPYVALLGDKQEIWTLENGSWKALPSLDRPASRANVVVHDGAPYTLVKGGFSPYAGFEYELMRYDAASKSWKPCGGKLHMEYAALDMDLAISPTGTPFVVVQRHVNTLVMTLHQGAWVVVGDRDFPKANGFSIAVDPISDRPIIAFAEYESKNVTAMAFSGTTWTPLGGSGAVSEGTKAVFPQLALSPKGIPMVAYGSGAGSGGYVKAWAHGDWKPVGGEVSYYGLDEGMVENSIGLAIDLEGEPFVAYNGWAKGSINVARLA